MAPDTSTDGRQPPHPQLYPNWLHPPPPPPSPSPPPQSQNSCTSPFLRAFAAGLVLFLIIAVAIYTIEYLIFGPVLPKIRVDSLQLANISAVPSVSAVWTVGFAVCNPNKKLAISLDNIESSIYFDNSILSQSRIHRFKLPRRNTTAVVVSFVGDSAADVSVLNHIHADLAARRAINFTVAVVGHVAVQTGQWRWMGSFFRASCTDLAVQISSPPSSAKLVPDFRQCQVL